MLASRRVNKEKVWLAAEGYLGLQMAEDAILELECLPEVSLEESRSQELLLAACMMSKRWNDAADIARMLCHKFPTRGRYFIHAAYCLHETGDSLAAKDLLIGGPKSLLKHALFHYNMGCYHAVLGDHSTAQRYVLKAFELDESLRLVSRTDSDLFGVDLGEF